MSDNWQTFADAMAEENRALAQLEAVSLRLTEVLVAGSPVEIEQTERRLEGMRVLHALAHGRRTTMQKRGFGELTLRQVCAYAPAALRRGVYTTLHELTTRAIALSMTVNNNKSLILAGMNRITRTVEVMQQSLSEQPGTYKRRGTVPPANGSVIVSRRA